MSGASTMHSSLACKLRTRPHSPAAAANGAAYVSNASRRATAAAREDLLTKLASVRQRLSSKPSSTDLHRERPYTVSSTPAWASAAPLSALASLLLARLEAWKSRETSFASLFVAHQRNSTAIKACYSVQVES